MALPIVPWRSTDNTLVVKVHLDLDFACRYEIHHYYTQCVGEQQSGQDRMQLHNILPLVQLHTFWIEYRTIHRRSST